MEGNEALLDCIHDIPRTLNKLYDLRGELAKDFVHLFSSRDIRKLYFSGQASGAYLGAMLKRFIETELQIEVQITNPHAFITNETFNVNGIYQPSQLCMICPAHSGTTPGPIEMAKQCRQMGIGVVTTTYDRQSPLALYSDVVIDKHSGPEASYIETRGHFASLFCLYLCLLAYGEASGKIPAPRVQLYMDALRKLPHHLEQILADTADWYVRHKGLLLDAEMIRYIAADEYEAIAWEGGLKIAETTHQARLAYEMEEFMHSGTTEIKRDSVIFLLLPRSRSYERMAKLCRWCSRCSDRVIALCAKDDPESYPHALRIVSTDTPYISVFEYWVPFVLLAYLLAEDRGQSVIVSANDEEYHALQVHVPLR